MGSVLQAPSSELAGCLRDSGSPVLINLTGFRKLKSQNFKPLSQVTFELWLYLLRA